MQMRDIQTCGQERDIRARVSRFKFLFEHSNSLLEFTIVYFVNTC